MTRFTSLFAWAGGGLFAASLATCAWWYAVVWGRPAPAANPLAALAVDTLLFAAFAAHHSLFARAPLKGWMARLVPEPLVRPVYVWLASVLLILLCVLWQPVDGDVYRVAGWLALGQIAAQIAGLILIARSVAAIDPLELAGIRPAGSTPLQVGGPYRWVRHPLYLGWMLVAFGTPVMTGDRLAFAVLSSAYLVAAIPWEERSLVGTFGAAYRAYCRRVRWKILPYVF